MEDEKYLRDWLENYQGMCDFSSPPHKIEAIKYIISHAEVKEYAIAYAEMMIQEVMPHTAIGVSMLRVPKGIIMLELVSFARGDDSVLVPKDLTKNIIIVRNKTDWAICEKCNKMWEQYKQKYPSEGG